MYDLYLITYSCMVQSIILSDVCSVCYYFFLNFTVMVDCVLSLTGTGMLLFYCCRGWLD